MSISGVKVLTVGKRFVLPYETLHVERTSEIAHALASFRPDVVVTSGFQPAALKLGPLEVRKRWIDVAPSADAAAVCRAVEACYNHNLWNENKSQRSNPLISVYTPTFNTGSFLRDTFESLRTQTYGNWEWVVVDDGSTDGTWDRLVAISQEDCRVRPVRLATRSGKVGRVKDTATRLCRGEYLVELDHDDMLVDTALQEIRAAFEGDPEAGMVYSNCACFFEDGGQHRFPGEFWKDRYRETEYRGKKFLECLIPDIYDRFGPHYTQQFGWHLTVGPHHVRAFRARTFFAFGGYNPEMPVADDWDLTARFFLRSKISKIDRMLYLYRVLDGYQNTWFTKMKAIQDHLNLARGRYAQEFSAFNESRLRGDDLAGADPEHPCFVVASRDEAAADRVRGRLLGQDVFVVVGARSIFAAYEEGRKRWAGRRRVVYVHDDVEFADLGTFLSTVRTLPDGTHGVCGSADPSSLTSDRPWWNSPPLVGCLTQGLENGSRKELGFSDPSMACEVAWLDGLCLITVGQEWTWEAPGSDGLWHAYDWWACSSTRDRGGRCMTIPQPSGPMLAHMSLGRSDGVVQAVSRIRDGNGSEGVVLTIAVLSIQERWKTTLPKVLDTLFAQADGKLVEVMTLLDNRRQTRSDKRNAAVRDAKGRYFAFVDDDDEVAPDYVESLLSAIKTNPTADIVVFDSEVSGYSEHSKICKFGLEYRYGEDEGHYYRKPGHLCAWRIGIVRRHPFRHVENEDADWSQRALVDARRQARVDKVLYFYRYDPVKSTQADGFRKPPPPPATSEVSFVVLDASRSELTEKCLRSVRQYAPDAEIVMVWNGVEPLEACAKLSDLNVRLDMNLGFSAGSNEGARVSTRRLVCFLNNDAEFMDDTPEKLARALTPSHPIVAPYSDRAKPPQGAIPRGAAPKTDALPESVVGMCLMMPRSLFLSLGGFDPRLENYDDDDLCARALERGHRCRVVGGTWIHHECHATFKELGKDVGAAMARSEVIFRAKWPKVRVIAIAKDEESAIQGFFDQFRPLTRDWCVLDTGSSDRTVEVARRAGANVLTAPFADFSGARNTALERFSDGADWIVMLDPDERLDAHTITNLKSTLAMPYDILLAPLEAVGRDGSRKRFVPKPFCFRVNPEIRWIFKVHEKLIGSEKQALVANGMIEHMIALHDPVRRGRSESLYQRLAKEEPYFTDPAFRERIRIEWPILDYDRTDDPRIAKVHIGPLVTVVIPTYRRSALLRRAVDSALAQNWTNLEVVVVGDACPDLKIEDYAGMGRVRVVNMTRNHGAGGAAPRNLGLLLAAGNFIAYLDDDNAWESDHVSSVMAAMKSSSASLGFSSMKIDGKDLKFTDFKRGGIDTSCVVHLRELVAKHGSWKDRAQAGYAHDWEFFSRLISGEETWVCTKRPTVIYNIETCGQRDFLEALASSS